MKIKIESKECLLTKTRQLFMDFGAKYIEDNCEDFFDFDIGSMDEFMQVAKWIGELINENHAGFDSNHYCLIAIGVYDTQRDYLWGLSEEERLAICDELDKFISDTEVTSYMVGM